MAKQITAYLITMDGHTTIWNETTNQAECIPCRTLGFVTDDKKKAELLRKQYRKERAWIIARGMSEDEYNQRMALDPVNLTGFRPDAVLSA